MRKPTPEEIAEEFTKEREAPDMLFMSELQRLIRRRYGNTYSADYFSKCCDLVRAKGFKLISD